MKLTIAKPTELIRVADIIAMIPKLPDGGGAQNWCNRVKKNNPPGQMVHADLKMLEKCRRLMAETTTEDTAADGTGTDA